MKILAYIGAASVIFTTAAAVAFSFFSIKNYFSRNDLKPVSSYCISKDGFFPDGKPVAVRLAPAKFPPDSNMPPMKESLVCGPVDSKYFSPSRDLVFVDDPRVWWESDYNTDNDDEDDHTVHKDLEMPLRRLIELVCMHGGTLKVHDSYRPKSIHMSKSLHKEGRAIDVTCDELGLESLAKLCWAAGFDFVLYETAGKGGDHIHCSVRRRGYSFSAASTNQTDIKKLNKQ